MKPLDPKEQASYEVKRTVVEMYYVQANSRKEALEIVGLEGGPATVRIKSETVKKQSTHQQSKK